jgi:hypothetical protein
VAVVSWQCQSTHGNVDFGQVVRNRAKRESKGGSERILDYGSKSESESKRITLTTRQLTADFPPYAKATELLQKEYWISK